MTAGEPQGSADDALSPAEREARWRLYVRFAIEADSADDAQAVLGQALAGLERDLPLRGELVIHPRHRTVSDGIWIAEITPDLTHLRVIDPDNAHMHCRLVETHFPGGVSWSVLRDTEREAMYEWPPDIWQRLPGRDDVLLHPAVRAVRISCEARQA